MPAYRSAAEGEIRAEVVERLRRLIPGCRIIHEINAASFGNRIDVMAVGIDRIAVVEIKSEKDKLDRLADQIDAMRSVSNMVYAAIHEKFLVEHSFGFSAPDEARGATVWAYPRVERKGHIHCGANWFDRDRWDKSFKCLPPGAIGMLWREELHAICRNLGMTGVSKMTMPEARDAIRWNMTGEAVTRAICATLRSRECIEADLPEKVDA